MERGVVFTAYELLKNKDNSGFETGRGISPEELNYLILYWDKLSCPTNNFIHLAFSNEEELIKCGVLSRPVFSIGNGINSDEMPEFQSRTQVETLAMLRREQSSIDWRMHFLNDQVCITENMATQKEVIRFELTDLLPVPQKGVPIHEILEFKERRSDELLTLHGYLDEVYTEVINSGDFNLQRAKALSGLKKSLEDLNRLNDLEWQSPLKFSISSSFELDMNQLYASAATVYAAMQSNHPFEVLFTGAALATLGGFVKVRAQFQNVLKDGESHLAYITNAKKEGLVI